VRETHGRRDWIAIHRRAISTSNIGENPTVTVSVEARVARRDTVVSHYDVVRWRPSDRYGRPNKPDRSTGLVTGGADPDQH
jgi:hypothetical protein